MNARSVSHSVSHRKTPKPIEAMLFMLPGIAASEAQAFRRWAIDAGLVHTIRGDGKRAFTLKDFSDPVPGGLNRNAHLFLNGHSKLVGQHHKFCTDTQNKVMIRSSAIMEAARKIPRATKASDAQPEESITLHMLGCEIGALRLNVTPNMVLWARGIFLLYGSKKSADSRDQLPCMEAALHYLGLSKQQPGSYDYLALFEAIASRRSNCIAIAGGKLCAAVIAHAPHALRDIMRPLFQEPQTKDPHAKQDKRISGPANALKRLVLIEQEVLAAAEEEPYPADEQIVRLMSNCIKRGELIELTEILAQRQDLLNATDHQGNSLLISAILSDDSENGIDTHPIIRFLIKHSHMINAQGMDGVTPLHGLAESDNVEMIDLILQGNHLGMRALLDIQNDAGETPLVAALAEGALLAAERLIDAGANVHLANEAGETPVMLAAEQGALQLMQTMLLHRPDLTARDQRGETAMMKAARNGHTLVAQALEKIVKKCATEENQPAPHSNQTQLAANGH
jgi:ankyrin repeat protein